MTQHYAVPEEGLKAAVEVARRIEGYPHPNGEETKRLTAKVKDILEEGFIRWQSESGPVPTPEQWDACLASYDDAGKSGYECALLFTRDWQRQMYLAPDSEAEQKVTLYNEVEIGWSCGMVTAGPFIRENVVWTPEQADQMAEYLKGAAQKARERNSSPDQLSPKGVDDLLWQGKKIYDHQPHELNSAHDADVNEAFRRGKDSHA